MKSLQRELLLTIAYTSQFGYPLTEPEVVQRRVKLSPADYTTTEVLSALADLCQAGFVQKDRNFYFLPGSSDGIKKRQTRQQATAAKFQEIQPLLNFLQKIPWVAGVAITGSAALYNAEENDDIDLLIVAEDNRLWLVRPFVILFAFFQGKRRSWQREEKNSWCFNLWLERRSVQQPKFTHSLYIAYEVCQTRWLFDRGECKQLFFARNRWAASYVPAYYLASEKLQAAQTERKKAYDLPFISEILNFLNLVAFQLQHWYMLPHMTRERVALSHAFFHPRDTKQMIFAALGGIVEKLAQRK